MRNLNLDLKNIMANKENWAVLYTDTDGFVKHTIFCTKKPTKKELVAHRNYMVDEEMLVESTNWNEEVISKKEEPEFWNALFTPLEEIFPEEVFERLEAVNE